MASLMVASAVAACTSARQTPTDGGSPEGGLGGSGGKAAAGAGGAAGRASGGSGGAGGAAGSGGVAGTGTAGTGGLAGTAGATGGGGKAGGGGSAGGGATCTIPCAPTAICDNGTCKSRITEFQIQTSGASPQYITAGPDGNLWFTDTYVGRITPTGTITEFNIVTLPNQAAMFTASAVGITAGPGDGNVWLTMTVSNGDGCVAVVTPSGVVTDYVYSTSDPRSGRITSGSDGNLWFAAPNENPEASSNLVRSSTPGGTFKMTSLPSSTEPYGIAAGSDGNLWLTEVSAPNIDRITPAGVVTPFTVPGGHAPQNIAAGADGSLWFTEPYANNIGRITTAGQVTEFPVLTAASRPWDITKGPDGNMWFTEAAAPGSLGRITPAGVVTELAVPSSPMGIATGPDGNLWFTEPSVGKIGRFLPP
jgi:virginiamycin B lyase